MANFKKEKREIFCNVIFNILYLFFIAFGGEGATNSSLSSDKVQYFGRASNNLNMNTRIKVYRTIISPSFSYSPTILYFGTQGHIDKLQLLQNRCMRIILKCDRYTYTSISNMLECLGLMNVKQFLFLHAMCFVYKLYHRQLPASLNFTLVNEIHDHETRAN